MFLFSTGSICEIVSFRQEREQSGVGRRAVFSAETRPSFFLLSNAFFDLYLHWRSVVFVSPTGQRQVHVPSIEQRRSKRILTRCSVWKLFWYLAYRDANRVKFNFDLLLGNVEPKTFLPLSLSLSRSRSLAPPSVRLASRFCSKALRPSSLWIRHGSSTNIGSGQSPRFARGFRFETPARALFLSSNRNSRDIRFS